MPDVIKDGAGKNYLAKVNEDQQLLVSAESESVQHHWSNKHRQAYQAIGTTTLANGVVTALHIKNISTTRNLVVTYIRHQIIDQAGGTTFPNASNYFKLAFGRTYNTGGSEIDPVNMYEGSGNIAEVTVYNDLGTTGLTGTAKEIDRWYTKAEGDMNTFNKEGALILEPQRTLELSYVGDQSSGTLYTRLSFIMKSRD